jgi:hypothetical protein
LALVSSHCDVDHIEVEPAMRLDLHVEHPLAAIPSDGHDRIPDRELHEYVAERLAFAASLLSDRGALVHEPPNGRLDVRGSLHQRVLQRFSHPLKMPVAAALRKTSPRPDRQI